jgi:hypothetical protein
MFRTGESLLFLYTTVPWNEAVQNILMKNSLEIIFLTKSNIVEFEGILEVINQLPY